MKNTKLAKLIRKYKGSAFPFRALPVEAQYAVSHYMSIDGEAWGVPPEISDHEEDDRREIVDVLKANIKWYAKEYGETKFGYVIFPMDSFLELFSEKCVIEWKSHKCLFEPRKKIWPVILETNFVEPDEFDLGPLEDGWHRLSDYIRMGIKEIPCVYYLRS